MNDTCNISRLVCLAHLFPRRPASSVDQQQHLVGRVGRRSTCLTLGPQSRRVVGTLSMLIDGVADYPRRGDPFRMHRVWVVQRYEPDGNRNRFWRLILSASCLSGTFNKQAIMMDEFFQIPSDICSVDIRGCGVALTLGPVPAHVANRCRLSRIWPARVLSPGRDQI